MKKWLLVCAALYSMSGFAGPVSGEDLKTVNDYLAEVAKSESPLDDLELQLVAANKDDSTNLLNSVTAEVSFLDMLKAQVWLNFKTSMALAVHGSAQVKSIYKEFDPEISDEEFDQVVRDIKGLVANAAVKISELAQEDTVLNVGVEFSDNSTGFGITFAITPSGSNSESEFNSLSLTTFYNTSEESLSFGFGFDGVASSDNLNQAGVYLSDIFNSLLDKKAPAESDVDALMEAVFASYNKVADQLDKYIDAIL